MSIDTTDRKILELLSQNGRMSYVDIAKELGLSRVAIRERINQLINEGIIEKFSVVINSDKLGKKVSAFFLRSIVNQHHWSRLQRHWQKIERWRAAIR